MTAYQVSLIINRMIGKLEGKEYWYEISPQEALERVLNNQYIWASSGKTIFMVDDSLSFLQVKKYKFFIKEGPDERGRGTSND